MNGMTELALILGLCFVGEWVAALLPVAFPASVISMVLLAALLLCGYYGVHLIVEVQSRYRYFLMPTVFLLAGYGLSLWKREKSST